MSGSVSLQDLEDDGFSGYEEKFRKLLVTGEREGSNMYPRLGYHTNVNRLNNTPAEYFDDHKVFQVMVGSPRTLNPGSTLELSVFKTRHPDVEVIVHTSYPVNMAKSPEEKISQSTLHYLIDFACDLDKVGVKYMVTHVGARAQDADGTQAMTNMYNMCRKWLLATEGLNIVLCLECDSGSKGKTKMGYVQVLDKIIRTINNPRIRMCFDTEHAYANGFDFNDIDKYLDIISVIHLNSVPSNVEFGGHLDRHSDTSFAESKVSMHSYLNKLLPIGIPMIQEFDPDRVEENYRWLEEVYSAKSEG